jgi:hypothetical protein
MYYCRFSDDDHGSDVTTFEEPGGGYFLNIARIRLIKPDLIDQASLTPDWVYMARRKIIVLPYAGKHFEVDTLEELKAWLHNLKGLGYNVPESAFDKIEAELNQQI